MDLQLAGKSALITGASKGIGRAAAQALAAEGCNVILVSRSAGDLAAAREQIRQACGVKVDVVAADLSDSNKIDELARDFPTIDILINNAGAIPGGTLLAIDEKTWRKAWDPEEGAGSHRQPGKLARAVQTASLLAWLRA